MVKAAWGIHISGNTSNKFDSFTNTLLLTFV